MFYKNILQPKIYISFSGCKVISLVETSQYRFQSIESESYSADQKSFELAELWPLKIFDRDFQTTIPWPNSGRFQCDLTIVASPFHEAHNGVPGN